MKILLSLSICVFFFSNLFSQNKTNIAVLDLNGLGISEVEAIGLSERLRAELFELDQYTLVERQKMNNILEEQGFQMSGCTSSECAVEVGRILGVTKIISGSITNIGKTYSINARIIKVETGEIENIASYDYKGEIDVLLLTGMKEIAYRLSGNTYQKQEKTSSKNDKAPFFNFDTKRRLNPNEKNKQVVKKDNNKIRLETRVFCDKFKDPSEVKGPKGILHYIVHLIYDDGTKKEYRFDIYSKEKFDNYYIKRGSALKEIIIWEKDNTKWGSKWSKSLNQYFGKDAHVDIKILHHFWKTYKIEIHKS